MKYLSLTQPYATLVILGLKRIETRSWATRYRGPLGIHAAAGLGPVGGMKGLIALVGTPAFQQVLVPDAGGGSYWEEITDAVRTLPLGAILGQVNLVDCVPVESYQTFRHGETRWVVPPGNISQEFAFGDYTPGRFAWLLDNVQPLPTPRSYRGALSLWEGPNL